MGCKSSTEKEDTNGGGGTRSAQHSAIERRGGNQSDPICHFCKKSIPAREFNAHTVQCDQREVTCWHSWCRTIVKQRDLSQHMEECGKNRKAVCVKCGEQILAVEMAAHRDSCSVVQCPHCPERVIGRIVKYCPVHLCSNLKLNVGPFAKEESFSLKTKNPKDINFNVARMQHLFRWQRTKAALEDIVFRSMYKEMDAKKEGFAIFKAHDKVSETHSLHAKKSRSLVQAQPAPVTNADYFFPTSTKVPVTIQHVEKLIVELRKGNLPPVAVTWRILNETRSHLTTLSNIQIIGGNYAGRSERGMWSQGSKTIVVGDLHGQLADLLYILQDNGMPSESTKYVFNGDFVDRGAQGMEIILVLFSLMLACPTQVALNRGNHECDYMNEEYGFDVEVSTKYDRSIYRLVQRCFCALPLAAVVQENIFVVHGGLPRREGVTLDDIRRVQRFRQIPMPELQQPEEDEIFQDMVWSDPISSLSGWRESDRGAGVQFGADITNSFLKLNKLKLVVRSHEEYAKGYEEHHSKKLITVFSASNYDGPDSNKGAIVVFVGDVVEPSFVQHHVDEDHFDIDDDAIPGSPSIADFSMTKTMSFASGGLHTSFALRNTTRHAGRASAKEEVLRTLRERVYQRRHRLLAYFTKLDRTQKGSVWKIEWVEAMKNCLNMELPWFFVRRYIAEEDPKTHRIHYADFLSRFHSGLTKLWLKDWEQYMALKLRMDMKAQHRSSQLVQTFADQRVNYNVFCSAMRTVDYTLTDAQLFQLFVFFDCDDEAHIDGNTFLSEIENTDPQQKLGQRWELDAMEQLQNITIQGRSQLAILFKMSHREKYLTKEKYMVGMATISRGMKKQLTKQQQEAIFSFIDKKNEGQVTFERFFQTFSVYDIERQSHPLTRHGSVSAFDIQTPLTSTTSGGMQRMVSFSSRRDLRGETPPPNGYVDPARK